MGLCTVRSGRGDASAVEGLDARTMRQGPGSRAGLNRSRVYKRGCSARMALPTPHCWAGLHFGHFGPPVTTVQSVE
ncbi:unnamed protein product [Protopolystoma xenopodis]|uniref:Uncharacterized protein n=1 Tax=Protopolystoma xenopodis TaxID=117903 RepID=A0A3S5A0I9_9PLAT|nr:unnamed protein product [Protopolystoma xenopodis]